ncbi:sensor histidine kinase [Hymenobacter ruricola]|uniref:Histidine kinase n=1 Tax=Hymenobacter ruricola TaxID=2791023 RepID=A0ABS0HYR9_9BACT|nr:histidine kinase [Hymenobacter ruricola]MBF9219830.1 histidine kinase [Hymenobacter ruricola]
MALLATSPPAALPDHRTRWAYLLTMPWLVLAWGYLLLGEAYWHSSATFAQATLLNAALLSAGFWAQARVAAVISRRLPGFGQTLRRVGLTLLVHALLAVASLGVIVVLYTAFQLFGFTPSYAVLLKAYALNLVALVLALGLYETFHSLGQWQQQQLDRETLKRENLHVQLQGLRSQVSPHFLFNSFNSLSSLIADEPAKAEQFVDEMARVYRYLLQTNGGSAAAGSGADELATLDLELGFIASYYHLLKTRHGPGLHLTIDVPSRYRQHRLPPLTLQLLVENAVKHNVILPARPLRIEIATTPQGRLWVRNNLQQKATRPGRFESTHIGLANIRARYQLLAQPEPLVEADAEYFTVTLPLLAQFPLLTP